MAAPLERGRGGSGVRAAAASAALRPPPFGCCCCCLPSFASPPPPPLPLALLPFSFSADAEGGGGGISASVVVVVVVVGGGGGGGGGGGFKTVRRAGSSRTLSLAADALISEAGTRAASTRAPGGSRPNSRPCRCLAQRECRFFWILLAVA
jgi:hypothetical protein